MSLQKQYATFSGQLKVWKLLSYQVNSPWLALWLSKRQVLICFPTFALELRSHEESDDNFWNRRISCKVAWTFSSVKCRPVFSKTQGWRSSYMSTCLGNWFHLGVLQKVSCLGNVCQEGIIRCEWLHELAMHKHATDLDRLCGWPTCKILNGLIRGLSNASTWASSIFLISQTNDSACTSSGTCDRIHILLTYRGLGWRNFDPHHPSRL
jgi:hypothetical protein